MTATVLDPWACPESVSEDATNRRHWLESRRRGVGGSDVPAILGMSRWDSPRDVWMDKLGMAGEKPDTWAMIKGRALELDLLRWFEAKTGIRWRNAGLHRNVKRPWMLGTPDGLTADGGIAECKSTSWRLREEWEDGPADAAELQGQWYLAVTGRSHLWVVAAVGDDDPTIQRVERDDRLIDDVLIPACARFWHENVLGRVEPPLTWLDRDTLAREFGGADEHTAALGGSDAEYAITMRLQAISDIKRAEKIRAESEARLIAALGDCDHLLIDGMIAATRKLQQARVVDMDALAASLADSGDDIDNYRAVRTSRVLRVPDPTKRREWRSE